MDKQTTPDEKLPEGHTRPPAPETPAQEASQKSLKKAQKTVTDAKK